VFLDDPGILDDVAIHRRERFVGSSSEN
jgi:hypothetical protein